MSILNLRQRSSKIGIRYRISCKISKITIYGPYYPISAKKRLMALVKKLQKSGFEDCNIVENRDNITNKNGHILDSRQKSFYYIENSHYNIFYYLKEGDKAGLAIELEHAKKYKQIINNSLIIIEMIDNFDDSERVVTDLLKDNPHWEEIEKVKIPENDDNILFEKVKAYLSRKLWEEII